MLHFSLRRNSSLGRLGRETVNIISRHSSASAEHEELPDTTTDRPAVKRNVSGLKEWHYRKYHGKPPVINEETAHLAGLRMQRRIWAQYGSQSGINPAIAWPVKDEWEDKMEYESLAYPDSLQEMVRKHKMEQSAKEEAVRERMEAIDAKMVNLEKWKKEIADRKRKKEQELQAAKEKHDRLIEEVKEYLGFKVDSKDPRFKEILEQKELEEKKRAKDAKKKQKQAKAAEKLRQMTDEMLDRSKPTDDA
ncbi:growth arrest and DNA damage-inducible proteins-interacting protein 1-like [Pollicipes pollicipes]|uniref:growth arrest and DNA damage-inducible proteins-interacting protein 1-like n=1 Tax=Pollicipes pollicipes TaxID=41117 RepID=UPI00188589C8|nr:growth arrest and DNA damage-inducible proteins-interacting protein 1-like [Pollicipes pollicipes]XP_037083433.1 growth arrest and DNA damage-inducible proteins-interacting protein 1-like [Pollicipes pollicipes]XP_037083434.1 growth arrest and DNA damage-inducible proteins-interacting protein 1-like [Pollicipes pollicipes]XP_037083436.1 growth arrest and DNA damage-inducible proteins-interacting protein 1-like [Pollicipes pollicipes]